jgi:hypothetical protein
LILNDPTLRSAASRRVRSWCQGIFQQPVRTDSPPPVSDRLVAGRPPLLQNARPGRSPPPWPSAPFPHPVAGGSGGSRAAARSDDTGRHECSFRKDEKLRALRERFAWRGQTRDGLRPSGSDRKAGATVNRERAYRNKMVAISRLSNGELRKLRTLDETFFRVPRWRRAAGKHRCSGPAPFPEAR